MDETEGRNVKDIIPLMLQIIPDEEIELKKEIIVYNNKLRYKSPELLKSVDTWLPLQQILERNIWNIDNEWKIRLRVLFNNDSDVEISR